MKYPKCLEKNGTIGFVAPSFGCNIEPYHTAFNHSIDKWKEMGYHTCLGPNCYEGSGIGISNTPEKCGQEFNEAWKSKESDVLISCGGGELMCEILDYVDFDLLSKAEPKWFMGYSDNTNLTFLLTTICDVASIYGPGAPAFGMEPWHPALKDALGVMTGESNKVSSYDLWEKEGLKSVENPLEPYHVTEPFALKQFGTAKKEGVIEGRLLGGCMDCLVNLTGTKYDKVGEFIEKYKEDGFVWFLESCDLNVMSIRRAVWQMKAAGWFQHVKGFLIGRPYCHGQELFGLDQYHAVIDLLSEYEVPILMDLDIGHIPPMMPIMCGSYVTVNYFENSIELCYEKK